MSSTLSRFLLFCFKKERTDLDIWMPAVFVHILSMSVYVRSIKRETGLQNHEGTSQRTEQKHSSILSILAPDF